MNKRRLLTIIVVFSLLLIGKVPSSFAYPSWWDSPTFETSGSGQFTRPEATSPPVGELEIPLQNFEILTLEKEVYFVLDWSTTDPDNSVIAEPVWFSWESSVQHYYSTGIWVGGNKVVDKLVGNTHHLEYNYFIDPQPAQDWAKITWAIGLPGNTVDYSYDFRSYCVPEPASLALGLIGLGYASWRLRRRKTLH